jgi:WD40 repeat protein
MDRQQSLNPGGDVRLPDSSEGRYDYEARIDPRGRILATELSSAPTTLWDISDIANPIELSTLANTSKYTSIVAFSSDGRTLATAADDYDYDYDYDVQLWDITEPRRPQRLSEPFTGFTDFISAVTFSPGGRTVFVGSADNTVRSWDITDPMHATPLGSPLHSPSNAAQTAFSPDGKHWHPVVMTAASSCGMSPTATTLPRSVTR